MPVNVTVFIHFEFFQGNMRRGRHREAHSRGRAHHGESSGIKSRNKHVSGHYDMNDGGVRICWWRIWTWPTRPRIIGVHRWAWNVLCRIFILWLDALLLIFFGILCWSALASTCLRLLLSHTVDPSAWVNIIIDGPIGPFATIRQRARNFLETWI
jgi:hypothetical protein